MSGDPAERVRTTLERARSRTFDALERDHLSEYRAWFRRVDMSLGGTPPDVTALPTDERIKRAAERSDPALAALYYQFGRYLLISSRARALNRPTCRGSGTTTRIRGGTRSTRSTSTSP
jgi:alpha-L-fucosidase 2